MFGIGSMMPIRQTFWYSTADDGDETRYQLAGISKQLCDVAVDAAEDYHGNHDGWESHWPILFTLYESEEGPPIARFEVERETVPSFFASSRELPQSVDAVRGTTENPS